MTSATATMKTWIDTRSFEEITEATEPTGVYQYVVDMILRDANIFRGDHTLYDLSVYRLEKELADSLKEEKDFAKRIDESEARRDEKEEFMIAFEKQVEKLAPDEGQVQSVEDHTLHKVRLTKLATHKKTFATMDKNHKLLILNYLELKDRIDELKRMCPILREIQDLTVKRYRSLHRSARRYVQDQNLLRLQKAVHWVCEYGDAMVARALREEPTLFEKLGQKPKVQQVSEEDSSWEQDYTEEASVGEE